MINLFWNLTVAVGIAINVVILLFIASGVLSFASYLAADLRRAWKARATGGK